MTYSRLIISILVELEGMLVAAALYPLIFQRKRAS